MANRAYLYPSDNSQQWECEGYEGVYYDSRHTFPLLWWFLFEEDSIFLVDIDYDGSKWKEIRLRAERSRAIERLTRRVCRHSSRLGLLIDRAIIDLFIERITQWKGKYIFVDPSEVFQDESEEDYPKVLDFIASVDSDFNHFEMSYGHGDVPDDTVEVKLVGYTYR